MFDIVGKRFWFFLIAGVVILVCIVSLATFKLKAGIEFSSGSMMTVSFEQKVDKGDLKEELASLGYASVIIQRIGEDEFLVRLPRLSSKVKAELEAGLTSTFDTLNVKEFDDVRWADSIALGDNRTLSTTTMARRE